MMTSRWTRLGAGLAAAIAAGGCAYDDYGTYGAGSLSVGGGYYGGAGYYGDPFYGPDYGYGYGWYDGFYYPGYGVYIYDRGGRRHNWRDRDRDHWRSHPRARDSNAPRPGERNWRGPRVADGNPGAAATNRRRQAPDEGAAGVVRPRWESNRDAADQAGAARTDDGAGRRAYRQDPAQGRPEASYGRRGDAADQGRRSFQGRADQGSQAVVPQVRTEASQGRQRDRDDGGAASATSARGDRRRGGD